MKRTGTCIQIGLDFSAEMNYLSRDDWRNQIRKQVMDKRIPKSIYRDISSWRYIGVDSNKESVDKLKEQHSDQEFICMKISNGSDLRRLFEKVKVKEVDALIIDVEGAEYTIFNTYDGDIIPKFISIECHRWKHDENELLDMHARHKLEDFSNKHDLSLFRVLPTNQEFEFPTVELQYMKKSTRNIQVLDDKLRIHMCGRPHIILSEDFNACAFTMKDIRFDESMSKRGHEIIYYGNEGGKSHGTHIDVMPKQFYEKEYGDNLKNKENVYDMKEFGEHAYTFNMRMCSEIRLRAQPGDIVAINNGAWCQEIVNLLSNLDRLIICEMSVGYSESKFAPYRVYESYSNQEFHKGLRQKVWDYHEKDEDKNKPIDAIHNTRPQFMDDVIPMFLDPRQFLYLDNSKEEKGDYYLYLGRLQWSKGVDLAVKTCEQMNEKLLIAGQCYTSFKEEFGYDPPDCVELLGHADVEMRKDLMSRAKGGFVCTYYPEPGGHVMGEYLLSGTPIITTDWGNMPNFNLNGLTGYRVRSGKEAELAIQHINAGMITSYNCRKWAMNFTMDRQARSYEYYLRRLRDFVIGASNNDLYYEHADVDLDIRTMIYPVDSRYDINLKDLSKVDKLDKEVETESEATPA